MYNWARTVKLCEKSQLVKPKNEEELIKILRGRLPHQKIKVKGTGMSCLGIGAVDSLASNSHEADILLDLSAFTGLVGVGEGEATFGAATTLQDISEILIAQGKQITACAGVLLTQTLAGAIATGTHGQGFRNGGLYDSVRRMRVVLADSTVHEYLRDEEDPDMFNALRLHLGCLGILTQITLDTEPTQIYKLVKAVTRYEDLFENYLSWNENSSHCKAWWFPTTDHVQVWRSYKATPHELDFYQKKNGHIAPVTMESYQDQDDRFLHTIDHLVEKMDDETKSHGGPTQGDPGNPDPFNEHNARFRTVTRFRSLESSLGNMYQLWCKGVPAPQINCELAIPLEQLPRALERLRTYVKESQRELHYPFILRATGPSSAWLSPSYGQRVCYIGFLIYLSEEDYSTSTETLEILKDVEAILSEYNGIPHYGKFLSMSRYDFPRLLPKWEDFLRLRAKVDPEGIFLNKFLKELFQYPTHPNGLLLCKL